MENNPVPSRCVVKFTSSYSEPAHRLMHSLDAVPRLLHCSRAPTVGKIFVVVMAYVENFVRLRGITSSEFARFEAALRSFLAAGFVFGDLRLPNVFVSAERRMALVDFDWSGDSAAYHPLGLNEDHR
ncbi:hypothetical protein B0H13DRAFT_1635183 [Mycena leptocephala]|nr:hypothetical protein B0H13DRAFT_1635183 [Mycena leptocephala]